MFVVSLTVVLGMAALVIDLGHLWLLKREAQNDADAVALAAAGALPQSQSAAVEAAASYHAANAPTMRHQIEILNSMTAGDAVQATVTTEGETWFAKLFGVSEVDVKATATARVGTYTGWAPRLLPWAIDEPSLAFDTPLAVKVRPGGQVAPGEFGAVDLITDDPKRGCVMASGANDYRNLITEAVRSCGIEIGDQIEQEPGNMAMTGRAIEDRGAINGFTASSILLPAGGNRYSFSDAEHPNIGVIPVIDEWVNGNSEPITVRGFAWFVITSYSKDEVTGVFVRITMPGGAICPGLPGDACPLGEYDADGISAVQLVD